MKLLLALAGAGVVLTAAPAVRATPPVIEIRTPMPAPTWALLERELLRANADACRAFFARYFDELTGASDDETRSRKADVVAEALRRLAADGADLSRPVMVGDRIHDIEGAAENRVPTIFVTWGYGSPAESAGAVAVVDHPAQLLPLLGLAAP